MIPKKILGLVSRAVMVVEIFGTGALCEYDCVAHAIHPPDPHIANIERIIRAKVFLFF